MQSKELGVMGFDILRIKLMIAEYKMMFWKASDRKLSRSVLLGFEPLMIGVRHNQVSVVAVEEKHVVWKYSSVVSQHSRIL